MLGLVFKTSVRHFVSQVGSTPTSFRQLSSFGITGYLHPCAVSAARTNHVAYVSRRMEFPNTQW